jgi:hypothetical protein
MRLYVRTLEEEVADWWSQHTASSNGGGAADLTTDAGAPAPTANGTSGAPAAAAAPAAAQAAGVLPAAAAPRPKSRSVAEVVVEGSWVSPYISSDKRPPPRYEHATAIISSELFIVGGNYGAPAGAGLPACWELAAASWLQIVGCRMLPASAGGSGAEPGS